MNLLAAVMWDVSPEIIKLGPISLRWYGLLFALGFVIGYLIMERMFANEGKKHKDLESLTITMVLGTVIGARLGHCLFYQPDYFLSHPAEILYVWHGGLASHGAAIGILIALWIYTRRVANISYMWILDRIVIVIALAGFLIRLGNFFNSEIYGLPADLPWAVVFRKIDLVPRHPVQMYESLSYLGCFVILFWSYLRKREETRPGSLFGLFLILVFGVRMLLENFKAPQTDIEAGLAMHMGQLLSIPLVIAGFWFLFFYKGKYQKKSEK